MIDVINFKQFLKIICTKNENNNEIIVKIPLNQTDFIVKYRKLKKIILESDEKTKYKIFNRFCTYPCKHYDILRVLESAIEDHRIMYKINHKYIIEPISVEQYKQMLSNFNKIVFTPC